MTEFFFENLTIVTSTQGPTRLVLTPETDDMDDDDYNYNYNNNSRTGGGISASKSRIEYLPSRDGAGSDLYSMFAAIQGNKISTFHEEFSRTISNERMTKKFQDHMNKFEAKIANFERARKIVIGGVTKLFAKGCDASYLLNVMTIMRLLIDHAAILETSFQELQELKTKETLKSVILEQARTAAHIREITQYVPWSYGDKLQNAMDRLAENVRDHQQQRDQTPTKKRKESPTTTPTNQRNKIHKSTPQAPTKNIMVDFYMHNLSRTMLTYDE